MEPELDQLQAPCTYVYTALKLVCCCVNWNDNITITHSEIKNTSERTMYGSIQALMQAYKCPKVHFDTSYLFISRINHRHEKRYWCLYIRIAARNTKEPQAGYLVTDGTRTTCYSIHFYTNARVLRPFVAVCVILWCKTATVLVKTPRG